MITNCWKTRVEQTVESLLRPRISKMAAKLADEKPACLRCGQAVTVGTELHIR